MIIKTLVENTAVSDEFFCEHGLSLYIETKNHKIIFDAGQTDLFLKNAQTLGVDISQVDTVVLSHGHYDHGGGINTLLTENSKAKILINENAFGDFYNNSGKYIGIGQSLKNNERVVLTQDEHKIDEGIFLFSGNTKERSFGTQSDNLFVNTKQKQELDTFIHEQYLFVVEEDKGVLISGCSHKGIMNILEFSKDFEPDYFVGGFHFMNIKLDEEGKNKLDNISCELLKYKMKYYTCHCTGVLQYEYLKQNMGERIEYLSSGKSIVI